MRRVELPSGLYLKFVFSIRKNFVHAGNDNSLEHSSMTRSRTAPVIEMLQYV